MLNLKSFSTYNSFLLATFVWLIHTFTLFQSNFLFGDIYCNTEANEKFLADECIEKGRDNQYKFSSKYNNQKECEANKGEWLDFYNYLEKATQHKTEAACNAASKNGVKYIWGRTIYFPEKKECLVALPPPECKAAMWSRVNHLGNGRGGQPLSYKWKLPHFPSERAHRCVLRIR